jgi:type II secretory ATPase GspE/PulE/Tfp pilus assembly ATPase PilB-like protein
MNTVLATAPGATGSDVLARLEFSKKLQQITNRIHATSNVDEIMLDLSQDISALFNCDRLTLYATSEDRQFIVAKVKTGLNAFNSLRLRISETSIAGHVALCKQTLRIADVYDEEELARISPSLRFLREVDKKTGYRTEQMLVAPLVHPQTDELVGVIQLINNRQGGPFGDFTEEGVNELAATLAIAFTQRLRPAPAVRSRYDALVEAGIISGPEFELATRSARRQSLDVQEVLMREFQVPPAAIGEALSKFYGVPCEPFKPERIRPLDLLRNLKRDFVEQNQWLPIEDGKDGLVILAVDPEQVRNARMVQNIFPRAKLDYRVATNSDFRLTVDQFYGAADDPTSVDDLLSDMEEGSEEELDLGGDISAAAENELVKLVNKIITDAYRQGASDIHIEPGPGKNKTVIRFRKDGALEPYIEIPASYRSSLLARIKIMCDLDISERRKPQDGKIKFRKFGPLDIELRVATIPSAGGVEDVVMRILSAGEPIALDKLGVLPHNLERLKSVIEKPYGLFFVCGPTGSGKTTTLHSVLSYLNKPDTKIWTAEDPVEITQKGLRQVQVNRKAGLDFATVMRAFLRADPDIIMVGEMRDRETVSIGLEASLTGHLVLATLHTNSAPESIIRLLDMGMDPFNFADAMLGILAQRLTRRLCVKCREAYAPDEAEVRSLLDEYCEELLHTEHFRHDPKNAVQEVLLRWTEQYADNQGNFTLYRAVGCDQCSKGYKGRLGLHELMIGSDRAKKQVQDRARVAQLLATALEDGMLTLKMDGIEKVLQGFTDMKQVRQVCIK